MLDSLNMSAMSDRAAHRLLLWQHWLCLMFGVVIVLASIGCSRSDRVEVAGRVKRKSDGLPLVGAKVTFRDPATGKSAIGYTDTNGKYTLGTEKVGEGISP